MGDGLTRGWLRSIAASTAIALVLGTASAPAMAAPEDEAIWEEGTVTSISDGDTLTATMDTGPGRMGSQRVRTVGVQAPESVDCGASQAKGRLAAQLPVGARVQTRAVTSDSHEDDYANYRIVRSLYAQDEEGNWYDTSRPTVSDGWMIWFPFGTSGEKPEWAHNLEYRVLADDAASNGRGLWSANLCGSSPGADLRVWVSYTQDGSAQPERVFIKNSGAAIDLGGWTVRDSALNYFNIPAGTVLPTGQVLELQFNEPGQAVAAFPGVSILVHTNLGAAFNNVPASNAAFIGDAVYLLDNAGTKRTGNLRAWFPYPCNPDDCTDDLSGKISIKSVQWTEPSKTAPSTPRAVGAEATTDGSGAVRLTWWPPQTYGGATIDTYVIVATPVGGSAMAPVNTFVLPLQPDGSVRYDVPGLALGTGYTFRIAAHNSVGLSEASAPTIAVTPKGPPSPPVAPIVEARDTKAVISWVAPASNGSRITGYTVRYASPAGPLVGTEACTTGGSTESASSGVTSCAATGLTNGIAYTFTVTARNGVGAATSAESGPSTPNPYSGAGDGAPAQPEQPSVEGRDRKVIVSWAAPADNGHQITKYTVRYTSPADRASSVACTTGDATEDVNSGIVSCAVTSLTNGSAYRFSVTATNAEGDSAASMPSEAATPTTYVEGRTSAPGSGGGILPDPWVPGQYVDLKNTSGQTADLGGYGVWDLDSSGGSTDNHAYLFPASQQLAAGATLRVHFGSPITQPTDSSLTVLESNGPTFLDPANDYLELASLNRAQVACVASGTATCRSTQQTSLSTPPVGVTARTTPASVTVAWGGPISKGGTSITGYTARAWDSPVGGSQIGSCAAGGSPSGGSCSFPGAIGTKYYVDVVATNAVGTSSPSWRVLAAPKTVPSAPGNVTVTGTPGGVNVTWSPAAENGARITRYTAAAYTAGTGGSPVGTCTTSNGSMGGCTIMRLQGGTQYFIDVTATNRAGNGAPSSPRVPGAPGPGGAVSTYSKGKVTVRWDPPTPGSNTITQYLAKLYTKSSGGRKVGECSAPAGATSCTTKKMKKRSKYYIDLTMTSASGDFSVKPRIVTGPAKKASAPKVASATAAGRHVVIAWAPPSFNGYSYLKGYGARLYSKSKRGSVKASCTSGPATLTCTTKALRKKGSYYASVRVKNSKGWSKWSSKRVKVVVR